MLGPRGRRDQHEGWAKSGDCSKECWENPLPARKSIRVARGNSSAWIPSTPSQLQSVHQRGRGSWAEPPLQRGPGTGMRVPWTLADLARLLTVSSGSGGPGRHRARSLQSGCCSGLYKVSRREDG